MQFSQGMERLHFSLVVGGLVSAKIPRKIGGEAGNEGSNGGNYETKNRDTAGRQKTHFLCLQGAHDNGTLFRLRTTRYCVSGEFPVDDPVEGGVGDITAIFCVLSRLGCGLVCADT